MGPRALIAAIAAMVAAAGVGAQARPAPLDLDLVLDRAATYVEEFRARLAGIVAEETYVQQESPGRRRDLRSDLLLVRSDGFPRWLQFRDTFEVDGRPVRERADRLSALFRHAVPVASAQAQQIASESSRYNLGPALRTINVPLMPLVFLERDVQKRFRFTRAPDTERPSVDADHPGHFRLTTEVWVVRFEERRRPTIIRDPFHRRDVPARGRFWIEAESGRILMSEMRAAHPDIRVDIAVSYQSEPLLGTLVPIAMQETYRNTRPKSRTRGADRWETITATAVYGRFRRVEVARTPNLEPGTRNPGTRNEPRTRNTNRAR
jgi:hypothetical protein